MSRPQIFKIQTVRKSDISLPGRQTFENRKKKIEILKFFSIFKSQASGKENVRFPNSLDFENFPDFWSVRDVR